MSEATATTELRLRIAERLGTTPGVWDEALATRPSPVLVTTVPVSRA